MSEGFFALLGAIVGGLLTELGQLWRDRREAARRRYADIVELYAVWVPEMRQRLWHHTSETWSSKVDLEGVDLKLNLFDPKGRQLRIAVRRSLPDELEDSERYERMKFEQYTGSAFEWPEFDTAMSALLEYVRRANPDAERVGLFKRR